MVMGNTFYKSLVTFALLLALSAVGFSTAAGYGEDEEDGGGGTRSYGSRSNAAAKANANDNARFNREADGGGEVLGEETFKFLNDLALGSTHPDVKELQKRLRAEGFFTFPTDTGYFGPITLEAVKAYQTAHPAIGYVTGFCGPLTRAELNK